MAARQLTWPSLFHIAASLALLERGQPQSVMTVVPAVPANAGAPDGPLSYSIEFSSFPDFAGNSSYPNTFSKNLLDNIANLSGGVHPYIWVGGNTQDLAILEESQLDATIGLYNLNISADYPTTITFGPKYFESKHARRALIQSVPYACNALQDKLLNWELGNEPDLFELVAYRPASWNESDYVNEWQNYKGQIHAKLQHACPEIVGEQSYTFYAPSFATSENSLDAIRTFEAGMNVQGNIADITLHNYVSGAEVLGVTLQGTLMNHSSTVAYVAKLLNTSRLFDGLFDEHNADRPLHLGEANSLYRQGRPGLSNTFGAAPWGLDFCLRSIANHLSRIHLHMGTNYRYQSWQPIDTEKTTKGTKAPYFGNIAVASFLGHVVSAAPHIVNLPLAHETEAAYAAYVNGQLSRLIVINMMAYNNTDYSSGYASNLTRPVEEYTFHVPDTDPRDASLQHLIANGSDAIGGITLDGYSYNLELDNGKPVLLTNVTGENQRV